MRKLIILLVVALFAVPVSGADVSHSVEAGATLVRGNSIRSVLSSRYVLDVEKPETETRLVLKLEGDRSKETGERFLGFDDEGGLQVQRPGPTLEIERYLGEFKVEQGITDRFLNLFAVGGASWDRNRSAGIRSRTTAFGGFGNRWIDKDSMQLSTTYSVHIERTSEYGAETGFEPDREGGFRSSVEFSKAIGRHLEFEGYIVGSATADDLADLRGDVFASILARISRRLSLRIAQRFNVEAEPTTQVYRLADTGQSLEVEHGQVDAVFSASVVARF